MKKTGKHGKNLHTGSSNLTTCNESVVNKHLQYINIGKIGRRSSVLQFFLPVIVLSTCTQKMTKNFYYKLCVGKKMKC